jgi:hypothetical protein
MTDYLTATISRFAFRPRRSLAYITTKPSKRPPQQAEVLQRLDRGAHRARHDLEFVAFAVTEIFHPLTESRRFCSPLERLKG